MNNKGLTLIELLIVIAILAALATPSFGDLIRRHQANILFSLMYLARTEAIKRNSAVTICKSNNSYECGWTWTDGWIVFEGNDSNGSRDADENLISTGSIGKDYQLNWTAFGSNNYIRFRSTGLTLSQNGTFKICPVDGDIRFARAVMISKTARVRLAKDTDDDGNYEDADGNALICS
ncbi:MAG: GspH/FimT family pseudopilin [Gammaproteobacteria bacterium]|nr:GspH/FimT family pseudopilin [Gammaproteobacteria bacterium]